MDFDSFIVFENVTKEYSENSVALKDVSFHIRKGEFISLVGRSGAGKSTVLKLLIREEEPSGGYIFFDGENINTLEHGELPKLRRRIGTVFQDFKLLPSKTAYENIAFALEVLGSPQTEIEEDVPQVLELVGLMGKAENFPHELSGGEKQRISLARALIHRPDIVVADEPTGNLDPFHTWEIINLLLKINQLGTTVILATHDKEIVNKLRKRVISLDKGKIIADEEKGKYIL